MRYRTVFMNNSRIAIATTDGVSVCDHLARSASFLVCEIEDGGVISRTVRTRGTDACGNHRSFVDLLAGCRAVICGGIGAGAANALAAHGVESVVLGDGMTVEAAIAGYLAGTLVTTEERVCLCG
jgi:predicted Fe-Mo cluster-binding NifX family protein